MSDQFCGECGAPIENLKHRFCTECGAPLSRTPEVELDAEQEDLLAAMYAAARAAAQSASSEPEPATELIEAPVVLEAEAVAPLPKAYTWLRRVATGEDIAFAPPATLGRGSAADARIPNNNAISRRHIRIDEDCGRYYLMDMGSANHTYLDGRALMPDCPVEIESGTVIRMANEDFIFMVEKRQ